MNSPARPVESRKPSFRGGPPPIRRRRPVIAVLGVYGVFAYCVVQRQQEIVVRLALGAQIAKMLALVLRDGLMPVLIGAAGGVGIAAAFARVAGSLSFGVSSSNVRIAAGAVYTLMAVGTTACLLPAHGTAAIDPCVL